jgi:predicted transcriptional regulator
VRFGTIRVNLKGAIKVPELTAACTAEAKQREVWGGSAGGGA